MANLDDLQQQLAEAINKIDALVRSKKWQKISTFVAAGAFLLLAFVVMLKVRPSNTAVSDRERQLYDSTIAVMREHGNSVEKQRDAANAEKDQLKKENLTLMNRYISNQEKHVIINQKKNETNPAVSNLSKDSLRREFIGN
jgi:ElaB/YqjD/DUF883 family membrane-anchored ribosome-binding protein